MTIPVRCESCGKSHQVDEAHAGRRGKCAGCGALMTVPKAKATPIDDEPGGYALDDPAPIAPQRVAISRPRDDAPSTFVRTAKSDSVRRKRSEAGDGHFSAIWKTAIAVAGVGAVILVIVALLVPGGRNLAAMVLIVVGTLMALVGYSVGAYAAFTEDFLYGFLYLVIPLYTAYYIVTRFDDLWRWATLAIAGTVLIGIGTALIDGGGGAPEGVDLGGVARRMVEV